MSPSQEAALDQLACHTTFVRHADVLFENDESSATTRKTYALIASRLTFFVEAAVRSNEIPFVPKLGTTGLFEYDRSNLAERYFKAVPDFIRVVGRLSDRYQYGEYIDIFRDACHELGIARAELDWHDLWYSPLRQNTCGRTGGELFNAIVKIIRRDWVRKGYKERHRRRTRETTALCREYLRYVDAWFEKLATIVFMRLDLSYKKEIASEMSLDNVVKDLNHLCANFRCNRVFHGLRAYIGKIEFGLGKCLHIHMLFMFDKRRKQERNHVFHTQMIGEYWVTTVTKGRGDYWNCNARLPQYEMLGRCGVGPIHVTDLMSRNNLANYVVSYLCKPDQFIRFKSGHRDRMIRRGLWPKQETKKLGAPRRKVCADIEGDILRLMPPETTMELEAHF